MGGSNKLSMLWGVIILVAGLFLGYWYGNSSGYAKAEADIGAAQDALAKKASEEAVKQANPFQAVNPLEGVSANPFEKAKKALNPFE